MKAFIDDFISNFKTDPRVSKQKLLARQNKWRFSSRRRYEKDVIALHDFQLFTGKAGKRLASIIQAKSDTVKGTFRIFDYIYFGEFGTKNTTVFEYTNSSMDLSSFIIQPKGTFSYLKGFFASPELLFATTPEFNKFYEISAMDKLAIRKDLNEDFLDELGDEGGWVFEGENNCFISYKYGQEITSSKITKDFKRFAFLCERLLNGNNAV